MCAIPAAFNAVTIDKKPACGGSQERIMFSGIIVGCVLVFWYQFIFKDGFNRDRFYAFLLFTGIPGAAWLFL